jgi:hypothetical protein
VHREKSPTSWQKAAQSDGGEWNVKPPAAYRRARGWQTTEH